MVNHVERFSQRIDAAAKELNLEVSRETSVKLICYLVELQKWNKTYNLTALKNVDEMLVQHVFDAMSVVPVIQQYENDDSFTVVDVGSGAGLPGIILSVWFPNATVVCVDSVEKKATFMRHVAGRMDCKNVKAIHGRIEKLPSMQADFVISRAFSSLTDFVRLAGHHSKEGGVLLAMKSIQVENDIREFDLAKTDWKVKKITPLHVPEIEVTRNVVALERIASV